VYLNTVVALRRAICAAVRTHRSPEIKVITNKLSGHLGGQA